VLRGAAARYGPSETAGIFDQSRHARKNVAPQPVARRRIVSTEPDANAQAPLRLDTAGPTTNRDRPWLMQAALYPRCYTWYIFLSSLDLMLTWVIIHMEGSELNAAAVWVIRRWDLRGLVVFKFVLVTLVIGICEVVGRRNRRLGQTLAAAAAGITAIPVALTMTALAAGFMR
jgi:hypothetical protein